MQSGIKATLGCAKCDTVTCPQAIAVANGISGPKPLSIQINIHQEVSGRPLPAQTAYKLPLLVTIPIHPIEDVYSSQGNAH